MKKNLTEVVFILDESGSMWNLKNDTIGGFNSMLEKQRKLEGECLISTVMFSDDSKVIYDRVPVNEIRNMTDEDYCPNGCTALLDAVGDAIHHISNVHKYIRDEDTPEKTLFIITTDGMENASHRYSNEKVKKMVDEKQKKNGWEFLFLAANIDAFDAASSIGISHDRAKPFAATEDGVNYMFCAMDACVTNMRERK